MRLDTYALDVPTTVAEGRALNVADLQSKYVQIAGLSGTGNIEGTIDRINWVVLLAAANGVLAITPSIHSIRFARTAPGTGTTAWVSGFSRSAE